MPRPQVNDLQASEDGQDVILEPLHDLEYVRTLLFPLDPPPVHQLLDGEVRRESWTFRITGTYMSRRGDG
jgi:hypothetical protein